MIYMRARVCAPTRLSPPLSYVQVEVAAKRHEEEDGEEEHGEEEDEGLEGARMPPGLELHVQAQEAEAQAQAQAELEAEAEAQARPRVGTMRV